MVTTEFKNIMKGMYGRTPAPVDPEIQKLCLGDEKPITCRPADLIEPELEKAKAEIGALAKSEEDVISTFSSAGSKEFLAKRGKKEGPPDQLAAVAAAVVQSSSTTVVDYHTYGRAVKPANSVISEG